MDDEELDLDDAFSDGLDRDIQFQFDSDAVREEIANALQVAALEEQAQRAQNGFCENSHQSVSTLDMDGSARGSQPVITSNEESQPASPSEFSHVPLSEDPESKVAPAQKEEPARDQETVAPYPNLVIDASKSPDSRIQITSQPHLPSDHVPSEPAPAVVSASGHDPRPSEPVSFSTRHSEPTLPSSDAPSDVPASHTRHRVVRSSGPTALQKAVSRTRPSFLPPKPRQEDDKHMADWREMMKSSRAAEEKRRKALQERRLVRERKIEESTHRWEKEIVPDWRVVHRNPALRKLWWRGIPIKLRATMWERVVGNALALSRDNYRGCLARAKRSLANGTFSAATMTLIEEDIATTLPALHIFHHETGPLYQDLKDMLCAWVVARSDEGLGYRTGIAKIAAMFLINMPPQQAFVVMRNLLERHCLRSFFGGASTKDDVEAYYRIFDTLLADGMPKIYFNFKQHQIPPAAYLPDWLVPLFLDHLPFEACARVWDVLLLEGDAFLYRAALGVLAVLEPRLFFPDRRELLELLRGENQAALEVARRDGSPLDGAKYEIYGLDEETLWERIDSMDEWWKESTWTRLIQRELPDL